MDGTVVCLLQLLSAIRAELVPGLELVVIYDPDYWRALVPVLYRTVAFIGPHGGCFQNIIFLAAGLLGKVRVRG